MCCEAILNSRRRLLQTNHGEGGQRSRGAWLRIDVIACSPFETTPKSQFSGSLAKKIDFPRSWNFSPT